MKWKNFKGDTLPQNCLDYFSNQIDQSYGKNLNIWQYGAGWIIAFYFGETPETATKWAIVLDDGGFYKVGATFSFWHPSLSSGNVVLKCQWSLAALHRSITAMKKGLELPFDPGYQT
jgi:hypothetical protein